MLNELRELYRYRELLYMIAYRDIRVRYKQSIMGVLWAILMPILIVMSGVLVRYGYAIASNGALKTSDIADVAIKSLPWAFIVSAIRAGVNSLILSNRELVTKIHFPKEIFPLAAVISSLFDLVIASGALMVLLAALHLRAGTAMLWVPPLMLTLIAFASGVSMLLAAAGLFFRDVKYIVEVVLTFGIFFTPVFYDVSMFGGIGKWLLLNPVAPILEGLSASVTTGHSPELFWSLYSVAVSAVFLVGGYAFFKHLEPAFAESI